MCRRTSRSSSSTGNADGAVSDAVSLDGSHGEGGGQILRTALTLSALSGRPFRATKVRAGRDRPGLRPQHLAAVRACAQICDARVTGDQLGSQVLLFHPASAPKSGHYVFDIPAMAGVPSAGSVSLLFQTLLLPLASASGPSTLVLRGGTHVRASPPYHYLTDVYMPMLGRIGIDARLELGPWGWYPRGGGEMIAHLEGLGPLEECMAPLSLCERGRLQEVWGISAASNLPQHIVQRQCDHARQRLRSRHIKARIERLSPPSPGRGTILFLLAEYEHASAGFSGFGRIRYSAEKVAEDATRAFEAFHRSGAPVDPHLADQLVLPLALAPGPSTLLVSGVTRHLHTVGWAVRQFLSREVVVEGREGLPGRVDIR